MNRTIALLILLFPSLSTAAEVTVCASGCIYTTINTAIAAVACGDVITVTAAETFMTSSGVINLTDKGCSTYTVIRSSKMGSLAIGQRVTGPSANLFNLRVSSNSSIITADSNAGWWWLEGFDASTTTGQDLFNLVFLASLAPGTGNANSKLENLAHHIVFNQFYISTPQENQSNANTGVQMAAKQIEFLNGTISTYAPATESHGISSANSFGPVYFTNMQITNSQIGTLFGGSTPNVSGLRARGGFFKGVYYYRPWLWRVTSGAGAPTGACNWDANGGERWIRTSNNHVYQCNSSFAWADQGAITLPVSAQVKNHYEEKNTWGFVVEGAVIANGWYPGLFNQKGSGVLHNLVDNDGSNTFEPLATIAYSDFANSIIQSVPVMTAQGVLGTYAHGIRQATFRNVLGMNLGALPQSDSAGVYSTGTSCSANSTSTESNYTFRNGTFVFNEAANYCYLAQMNNASTDTAWLGVIAPWMSGGFADVWAGGGSLWNAIYNSFGNTRSMAFNVLVNDQSVTYSGNPAPVINLQTQMQQGSANVGVPPVPCPFCQLPSAWSDVGFTSFSAGSTTPADFKLSGGSSYLTTGPYGQAPGADIDVVTWATQGTVAGTPNPFLDFQVIKLIPASTTASIRYLAYNTETCTLTVSPKVDYSSPTFTNTDSGGDLDRTVSITGLTAKTRYFWKVVCGSTGWRRSETIGGMGPFITAP